VRAPVEDVVTVDVIRSESGMRRNHAHIRRG
jgi:hypothetical protein